MKIKGVKDYQKTHLSNDHYKAHSTESLIINYNTVVFSSIDITLESVTLNAGTPFVLKRAFKRNGRVFIDIETEDVVSSLGFKRNKNNKIKNRKQLRSFLDSFVYRIIAI